MPKITIEIEDTLPDRLENLKGEIREEIEQLLTENPDYADFDSDKIWDCADYSGALHGLIDASVPIYTGEIKAAWYLHGSEIEEAYENAGIGHNPRENDGMTAIYCWLESEIREWFDGFWDDFQTEIQAKIEAEND